MSVDGERHKRLFAEIGRRLGTAPLHERLRYYRLRRGLSQEQLAWRSGVSCSTITKVEARGTDVSLATVRKLAGALRVTFGELLD